jgi:nucleoside-diphosphate-sugar epimerase
LRSNIDCIKDLNDEILTIQPTHVIHLAAISIVTHKKHDEIYRTNIIGTNNLLLSLSNLKTPPKKIIIVSSANVYGNSVKEVLCEEDFPRPISHYAISKLAMEHLSFTYLPKLPIIVARPFNYTGKDHDDRFLVPKIVNHFKNKENFIELGNIDVFREYNDVRLVCDSYLKLLNFGCAGEIYNICTGRSYSIKDILNSLTAITGHNIKILTNSKLIRNNEVVKLSGNPSKFIKYIGNFQAISLEDTLRWMLEK